MPTFLIVISESGVIKPATMKNAAEESLLELQYAVHVMSLAE